MALAQKPNITASSPLRGAAKYADVSAIPGGPVGQMVAVTDCIDGPWKIERMAQSESLGMTGVAPARARSAAAKGDSKPLQTVEASREVRGLWVA
jgi:hypothetical protein